MAVLPPWDHDQVARKIEIENIGSPRMPRSTASTPRSTTCVSASKRRLTVSIRRSTRARIDLEARIDRFGSKIDQIQVDLNARMDSSEVMIGARLDQRFARLLTWTVGMSIAFAGLIIAATSLT